LRRFAPKGTPHFRVGTGERAMSRRTIVRVSTEADRSTLSAFPVVAALPVVRVLVFSLVGATLFGLVMNAIVD
jgi:hypothetical protein